MNVIALCAEFISVVQEIVKRNETICKFLVTKSQSCKA